MEKFHTIDRVVGKLPEADKELVFNYFKKRYLDKSLSQDKDLSPEQQERLERLVDAADTATDEIRQKFGVPKMPILSGNVKVDSRPGEDIFQSKEPFIHGHYDVMNQEIAVKDFEIDSAYFHAITHEMLHMKSYTAIQYTEDEQFTPYRVGLTVSSRDGRKRNFLVLEEAVNEELVKSILYHLDIVDASVTRERSKTEENRILLSGIETLDSTIRITEDTYYLSLEPQENGDTRLRGFMLGYTNERKALWLLIDRLFAESRGTFSSKEDIFSMFVKAKFDGNILPIGRLIDEAFGAGSFRKIGELEPESPMENYEEIIRSL